MKGVVVAYVRVSTLDQNPDRQLEGVHYDKLFSDAASGSNTNRPQLEAMLSYVREGDTVLVHSMDRLARSLDDLRRLVKTLNDRSIKVVFAKEGLSFSGEDSPVANLILSVMGACAEFERSHILERQREGIALAKKKGVYTGRRPALNTEQVSDLKLKAQTEKKSDLAKSFNISRSTLYAYLKVP